ncbi:MAG: sulfatase-like hydrolase/transferase [Bacillota bacterium]
MSENRYNIIIFNPDQFRADALHHLGNPASVTPNFDKIVESEGVSFNNAFCQNPVCTPSRCSFMTGWYPHVRGHRTMFHMLHKDEPVLLKRLKDSGYFVWWGGKNDLIPGQYSPDPYCDIKYEPEKQLRANLHIDQNWRGEKGSGNYYSFYAGKLDTGKDEVYYDSDWAHVEGAADFIKNYSNQNKPFCIYLPLSYPHPPYGVEEPWYSKIDRNKIPSRISAPESWENKPSLLKGIYERQNLQDWDEEEWRELRATYLGMCSRLDYQFGLLMEALDESGQYDNTAVFIFSDHGDFTGDYGLVEKTQNTFEDCLTNVPLIIKPPAEIDCEPGIKESLVELIDFTATVEDLTDIKRNYTHFGKSLLPVIRGEKSRHRDAVFCEGGRLHGETHCMELESEAHQNPSGLYWPRVNLQTSEGPEHTKAVMCRTENLKYVKRLYEKDELYDLKKDPEELTNLIDKPAYSKQLMRLKERLLTYYLETDSVVPHETDKRNFDR